MQMFSMLVSNSKAKDLNIILNRVITSSSVWPVFSLVSPSCKNIICHILGFDCDAKHILFSHLTPELVHIPYKVSEGVIHGFLKYVSNIWTNSSELQWFSIWFILLFGRVTLFKYGSLLIESELKPEQLLYNMKQCNSTINTQQSKPQHETVQSIFFGPRIIFASF